MDLRAVTDVNLEATETAPERVLIADDHPLVRAGLKDAVERGGFLVCAEAVDAPGAVEAALRESPDICLLDVRMPGDGIWAAREITQKVPRSAVVMVTAVNDFETVLAALRAGAVGYLPKNSSLSRLPQTLRAILRGEVAIPRDLTARVLSELHPEGRARRHHVAGRLGVSITSREADVLELLQQDLTTAEISAKLFLTPATVRTHVSAVMRKFGVRDRQALLSLLREG